MSKTQSLIHRWQHDELARFTGRDFSYIKHRMTGDIPPWSYLGRARQLIQPAAALLDMDTGGGGQPLARARFLCRVAPGWFDGTAIQIG